MGYLFLPESCADFSPEDSSPDRLSFYRFDISRLLKHGASLLGSAGAEFEVPDDKSGMNYMLSASCILTFTMALLSVHISEVVSAAIQSIFFLFV